jgi:Cdc6-like AAA superfamily ATPase
MKILKVISENKASCTFALNGAWGTGKTFVLNMLMNQLWEYHSDKYIVFHYNCWQYDYYEEPLIAIVAAMLDSVDEENHLLPAHLRDKAKAGLELAKPVLQKIATDFVKNKIGVDLTEVVSSAKAYQDALDSEEQTKAEARLSHCPCCAAHS